MTTKVFLGLTSGLAIVLVQKFQVQMFENSFFVTNNAAEK